MGKLVSPLTIVGLCALLVAMVLQIVGLATTYWTSVSGRYRLKNTFSIKSLDYHRGLFEVCGFSGSCQSYSDASDHSDFTFREPAWLKTVRGLEITSVILAGLTFLLLLGFIMKMRKAPPHGKVLCILMAVTCIFASVCSLVGCLFYWLNFINTDWPNSVEDKLDYSFFLCFAAGIIFVVDGVFLLVSTGLQVNKVNAASGLTTGGQVIQPPTEYQVQYQGPGTQHSKHPAQVNINPASQPGMYPANQPAEVYPYRQPHAPTPGQPALNPDTTNGETIKVTL